ncbi:MAG TPA: GRP family sugar transporter [Chloroflexota bacterium]|nr:GRP family sugar transporter [Chloroflexota bacterium]
MLALAISVLSAVVFGHVMKFATVRRANLRWVAACNYITGSSVCFLIMLSHPPRQAVAFTVLTGAWAGVSYLISLLFYFAAVARLGMSLATSVNRISVALPVAAALIFWHEALHPAQAVGLALVVAALLLLGSGDSGISKAGAAQLLRFILPLFLITGVGQLGARIYSAGAPAANAYLYSATLFAAAGVSGLVALALRPVRPQRQDVLLGLLLGAFNTVTNLSLLAALRALPSALVFSISSAASVALAAITGVLFWHERLSRPAMAAITAATLAVVLLTQ